MASKESNVGIVDASLAMLRKQLSGWERLLTNLERIPRAGRNGWWHGQYTYANSQARMMRQAIANYTNGDI